MDPSRDHLNEPAHSTVQPGQEVLVRAAGLFEGVGKGREAARL